MVMSEKSAMRFMECASPVGPRAAHGMSGDSGQANLVWPGDQALMGWPRQGHAPRSCDPLVCLRGVNIRKV